MNREDYGSCYANDEEDVREFSGPTAGFADGIDDQRGFRLVHDSREQCCRGGTWSSPAVFARDADRDGDYPGRRLGFLGFRLVWGKT